MRSFIVVGTNLGIKTSMWRVRNTMDSCQIGVVVTCNSFAALFVLAFGFAVACGNLLHLILQQLLFARLFGLVVAVVVVMTLFGNLVHLHVVIHILHPTKKTLSPKTQTSYLVGDYLCHIHTSLLMPDEKNGPSGRSVESTNHEVFQHLGSLEVFLQSLCGDL